MRNREEGGTKKKVTWRRKTQLTLEKKDFEIWQQMSIKPFNSLHRQNTTTEKWRKYHSSNIHVNEGECRVQ